MTVEVETKGGRISGEMAVASCVLLRLARATGPRLTILAVAMCALLLVQTSVSYVVVGRAAGGRHLLCGVSVKLCPVLIHGRLV